MAAIGGLALLIALGLPWFEPGRSGFSSLRVGDLLLVSTALMAISLPLLSATQEKSDLPIVWASATVVAAIVATVLVGYHLINPLGGGREEGLYLALGAGLVVCAGAWSAIAGEGA